MASTGAISSASRITQRPPTDRVNWVAEVQTSKDGNIYALPTGGRTYHEVIAQNGKVKDLLARLGGSLAKNVDLKGRTGKIGDRTVVYVDSMRLLPVNVTGKLQVRPDGYHLIYQSKTKGKVDFEIIASTPKAKAALAKLERAGTVNIKVKGPELLMADPSKGGAISRPAIWAESVTAASKKSDA